MCYRFAFFTKKEDILAYREYVETLEDYEPSYNVAPGACSPVVTRDDAGSHLRAMRWGLVPAWAPADAKPLANARAESAAEKPSFRHAFAHGRCLVLASGFYEWTQDKQPWYIRPAGREFFAFAGLYERHAGTDGYTILTVPANDFVGRIHPRMPVILAREDEDAWLLHGARELLRPWAAPLEGWAVSRAVNRVAAGGPQLVEPVAESELTLPF